MNAIYKVIWNDAIRQYQVVNELCRSRRKACSVKAVHTETASGSHSVVSSLRRGALIAGTTLAMLTAWGAQAASYTINQDSSIYWDLGQGFVSSDQTVSLDNFELPVVGDDSQAFRIVLDNVQFANVASSVYGQDETGQASLVLSITGSGAGSYLAQYLQQSKEPNVVFVTQNEAGAEVETKQLTANTSDAIFSYTIGAQVLGSGIGLTRELSQIEFVSQTDLGQYLSVSQTQGADLKASLIGEGNVTFGIESTGVDGWLTLNNFEGTDESPDKYSNQYTGTTHVGFSSTGNELNDAVHIVFGKHNSFGKTSLLNVATNSEVRFGGMNGDKAYTQTVGGLSGAGTLALGSAAQLTLAQSVQQGIIDNESDKIAIQNDITGTGATGSTSGAVFNIELSGEVGGYEVVFADQDVDGEDFTGLITLKNGAVTAYRDDRSDSVGDYDFEKVNQILTGSTLQLKDNAWLKIDETGSVNNLIVSDGVGGLEYSGLANVGDDEYALKVTGDLTLDGDATVYIEDLDFDLMKGEAQDRNLLAADDGFRTHLIDVEGTSITNGHSFTLDKRNQQENQVSDITQGEGENKETVAKGTWELEDTLRDNGDGTFDLAYTLTKVEVLDGKTLQLTGEANATEVQNFIAQITDADGTGNVEFSAGEGASGSGTVIEVGYQSGEGVDAVYNDYTGTTTVTEGTTVVLIRDSGFGDTSELLAQGDVTLSDGIKQTIHGINSNGSGTITLNENSELTLDADSAQTINNVVAGTGDLIVDLGSSGNSLIFKNDQQGNRFTGDLTLSNGRFSLGEGQNVN